MGIRTFSFNGESSDTYGILINKNASFNAPERAGEMLSIPGRNGAYWHDLGRFENIEVTYKCAIGEGTKADFVDAMSDLRSWLCSPIGYCRLEDDYNPNEYRMAVYKSGLETDEPFLTGAEFDIVFECKPQRFLKSGETAISVTSGDTITNPTLFDSHPLFEVYGYGDINFNGQGFKVLPNTTVGLIPVAQRNTQNNSFTATTVFDDTYLVSGDTFYCLDFDDNNYGGSYNGWWQVDSGTITGSSASFSGINGTYRSSIASNTLQVIVLYGLDAVTFSYGTSATKTTTATISVQTSAYGTVTGTIKLVMSYNGVNTISLTVTETLPSHISKASTGSYSYYTAIYKIWANSTFPAVTGTMYIDLDIGEAYLYENDSMVSVNNSVSIPAELPTIPSGTTTITYDNTFTTVKVTPRWWKV